MCFYLIHCFHGTVCAKWYMPRFIERTVLPNNKVGTNPTNVTNQMTGFFRPVSTSVAPLPTERWSMHSVPSVAGCKIRWGKWLGKLEVTWTIDRKYFAATFDNEILGKILHMQRRVFELLSSIYEIVTVEFPMHHYTPTLPARIKL